MTIQNQKDARSSLVAAIKAGIALLANDTDGTAHTLGYLPKSLAGLSPMCTVEDGPVLYSSKPAHGNQFKFIVGIWTDRADASIAEDQVDDLSYALALVIDGWHNGFFYQESQADYIDMDNQTGQYRVMWHFVQVEWE